MSTLYYNAQLPGSTSNVCGYGNHLACDMGKTGCECICGHTQDTPEVEVPEEIKVKAPEKEQSNKVEHHSGHR